MLLTSLTRLWRVSKSLSSPLVSQGRYVRQSATIILTTNAVFIARSEYSPFPYIDDPF